MSYSWKDTAATVSMLAVVGLTIALMMGSFESIDSRWALGTSAALVLGGITGLITGTTKMMQGVWTSLSLYILSLAALTITIVNAFLNSEAWFVAMTVAYVLVWLEFITVDLFSTSDNKTNVPHGGTL